MTEPTKSLSAPSLWLSAPQTTPSPSSMIEDARREAMRPIYAPASEYPYAVAGLPHDQPVAVVLDSVDQMRARLARRRPWAVTVHEAGPDVGPGRTQRHGA